MSEHVELLRAVSEQNDLTSFKFKRSDWKRPPKRNKNSKQLISDEWKRLTSATTNENQGQNAETTRTKLSYFNVQAYPSGKPAKKYCDITGLKARYKAPNTGLRFHNSEVYSLIIKPMVPGAEQDYLKLRGDNFVLK